MFRHKYKYTFHISDSLLPPSVNDDGHMKGTGISLENLCANVIVRNGSCKIFSITPRHLYKILMSTYLRDKYYKYFDLLDKYSSDLNATGNNNRIHGLSNPDFRYLCASGSNLPELLYHWPDREFILKEVMPLLPLSPNPETFE